MKLDGKKEFAARTLGVGKGRIVFNIFRLNEIKEAITKQDIRELYASGAIKIKEIKGRVKIQKRKTRRREGSFRKKPKKGKQKYVRLTRKLRAHLKSLKNEEKLPKELHQKIRREIRSGSFRNLTHMKERIVEEKNA